MAKSGSNPQFLNVEKKVVYNIRLPQRLIDKLNGYADLTGNTTTNVVTNILSDFVNEKVVLNDYLDNTGGLAVKIPYAIYQKNRFMIDDDEYDADLNLLNYNKKEKLPTYYGDTVEYDTYFAELFEVKKIPNNLDINSGDSYTANDKTLLINKNAIHSGIELFVYNLTEIIFADAELLDDKFDSFLNCLYCLYFEVGENNNADVYLIDYMKAINLLSASGNDKLKDLIVAVVMELETIDGIVYEYLDKKGDVTAELISEFEDIPELKLFESLGGEKSDKIDELIDENLPEVESAIRKIYAEKCNDEISEIAKKYNTNNIIPFGNDIFSRLAVKEIEVTPDYFDDLIGEKIDAVFNDKFDELEKNIADNHEIIDKINNMVISLKDEMKKP